MKIRVGRCAIEISNYDKVLFGKSGITKGELIEYYSYIAPIMLPYCVGRPVSMNRFPGGIDDEGFYQKEAGNYFPEWIKTIAVPHRNGNVNYVMINNAATLIYLANQACITPHLWLSRSDKLNQPDRIIFDLDPSAGVVFDEVQWVAKKLKSLLDNVQLPSYYMLTGSRGLHIIIPLKRLYTFEQTRAFAYDVASLLARQFPEKITVEMSKKERKKRVFIDWLRNGFGATGVAPYAVRALEGAPIAMPVTWEEVSTKGMMSQKYTIKNVHKRIKSVGDIWHGMQKKAVSLTSAQALLADMIQQQQNL